MNTSNLSPPPGGVQAGDTLVLVRPGPAGFAPGLFSVDPAQLPPSSVVQTQSVPSLYIDASTALAPVVPQQVLPAVAHRQSLVMVNIGLVDVAISIGGVASFGLGDIILPSSGADRAGGVLILGPGLAPANAISALAAGQAGGPGGLLTIKVCS